MNIRKIVTSSWIAFLMLTRLYGHGWSEEMRRELSASTPDWLVLGVSIKVDPVMAKSDDEVSFRPISGDSSSTRDRVSLPSRGIDIEVDYPISWYHGSSLSPDGKMLIINSGAESKLYEIQSNGQHRQIDLKLPHVTYDVGPKGYITGWSWADDATLLGEAEIDSEKGEFIERRIYVFHMKESALSRLDVSALNLATTEGLTVTEIGTELGNLRLSIGDAAFTVSADLKSPPKLIIQEGEGARTEAGRSETNQLARNTVHIANVGASAVAAPESSIPWSLTAVLTAAAIGLLWFLLKRGQTGKER